jgi:hypothetical protein
MTRTATVPTRAAVLVAAVAAGLASAWLLHQAAAHAYASQVYYPGTNPPLSAAQLWVTRLSAGRDQPADPEGEAPHG